MREKGSHRKIYIMKSKQLPPANLLTSQETDVAQELKPEPDVLFGSGLGWQIELFYSPTETMSSEDDKAHALCARSMLGPETGRRS